jgi:hypothetical protein
MADMFDEKKIIGVSTGFQAFFGNEANGAQTIYSPDANTVDIDIIKGNERIAGLIPRGTISRSLGSNQKNVNSERFSTFSRKFPLSEEEGDITADMILYRVAGEGPTQRRTRLDRMRHHAIKIHTENIRRTARMFEVLAAQSIRTGKQDAIIGTTDTELQYDFRRKTTHDFAAPAVWDAGTPDILADFDTACDLGRQDGKITLDGVLLGKGAMNALINDTVVQTLADNRRFKLIDVSSNPAPERYMRFVEGGFTARGSIMTPKGREVWLFTYDDGYTNDAGTFVDYMPTGEALFFSSRARCDRYFGPPETLPMIPQRQQLYTEMFGFSPDMTPMPPNAKAAAGVLTPAMFYADAYVSNDWKKISLRTQSAPIFATTHTDAFVRITGLLT